MTIEFLSSSLLYFATTKKFEAASLHKRLLKPWFPIYILSIVYVMTYKIWTFSRHLIYLSPIDSDSLGNTRWEDATEIDRENFCNYRFGFSSFDWTLLGGLIHFHHVFWVKQALLFAFELVALIYSHIIYHHLQKKGETHKFKIGKRARDFITKFNGRNINWAKFLSKPFSIRK